MATCEIKADLGVMQHTARVAKAKAEAWAWAAERVAEEAAARTAGVNTDESLAEQAEWAAWATAEAAAEAEAVKKAELASVMRHAVEACGPLPASETAAFDAASVALDAAGRETGPDRKRALARLVLALTVLVQDQPGTVRALADAAVTLADGAECLDRRIRGEV